MLRHIFQKKARGQILAIMAFVLVLLLGVTALAIDGAMVYSDRRVAQNASDAAALAGAGMAAQYMENHSIKYDNFSCSNTDVVDAMNTAVTDAIDRADTNSFTIDGDISDLNGVHVTCNVQNIGPYVDEFLDVQVKITTTSHTSFIQMFYSGPVKSTVDSIVRVHPRTSLGFGYAVASLGTDCTNGGITAVGNAQVNTTNAGIFSNSCLDLTGNVDVNVSDPMNNGIRYVDSYSFTPGVTVDPPPVQSPVPIKTYNVPTPDCSILPSMGSISLHTGNVATINPGNYTSIRLGGNSQLTLNPGLYCLYGNFTMSGGQYLTGHDVTIYFVSGGFSSTGLSSVNLTAPNIEGTPENPVMRGMLMFAAVGNNSGFTLTGNAGSQFVGTVYAPNADVTVVGNAGFDGLHSQIIGESVFLNGNSTIQMEFDSSLNYQVPASLDTMK